MGTSSTSVASQSTVTKASSIPDFTATATAQLMPTTGGSGGFPASPKPFDASNSFAAAKPMTLDGTAPTVPTTLDLPTTPATSPSEGDLKKQRLATK